MSRTYVDLPDLIEIFSKWFNIKARQTELPKTREGLSKSYYLALWFNPFLFTRLRRAQPDGLSNENWFYIEKVTTSDYIGWMVSS